MALPTFIIIGAAKAGTTSLHYYLDLHPEVQMSAVKETNFFAGPPNGRDYELGQVESLEAYEELFDAAVPVRGEASPNYANDPIRAGAAKRIKGLIPEAKIIYLVRDPVEEEAGRRQDPVAFARSALIDRGLESEGELDRLDDEDAVAGRQRIDEARFPRARARRWVDEHGVRSLEQRLHAREQL